ncbi:hypothetical protein [Sorangium sp. So ce363]
MPRRTKGKDYDRWVKAAAGGGARAWDPRARDPIDIGRRSALVVRSG